ncbi:MAG: hypothetical protein ACTS4T_00490 [Candidatus Hodgkinia cicadicola]
MLLLEKVEQHSVRRPINLTITIQRRTNDVNNSGKHPSTVLPPNGLPPLVEGNKWKVVRKRTEVIFRKLIHWGWAAEMFIGSCCPPDHGERATSQQTNVI